MNNNISGDFNNETLEAFRAMYAQRQVAPEELEVDKYTGLPTDVVTNVSPWIEHTGLWRANPGTERDFVPNQVLQGSVDKDFEDIRDFDGLSEEEFDALTEKVISEIEEEEAFADLIYNSDDEDDERIHRGQVEDDEMTDDELERILASILEDDRQEAEAEIAEKESLSVDEGVMSDDDLDRLIAELLTDTEDEGSDMVEERESEGDLEDDDLEDLIKELLSDSDGYDEEDFEDDGDSVEAEQDQEIQYQEDVEGEEEEMTEDEIDNLIDQIMSEFDDVSEGGDSSED